MRIAVFSTSRYDKSLLTQANSVAAHVMVFLKDRLTKDTAALAQGCPAVCVFVNDTVDAKVLALLAKQDTRLVATRSTSYNHIDVDAAARMGIQVVRVTDYSPQSVAEFAARLLQAVKRQVARECVRTREGNSEMVGLMDVDLHGKTVGVIGTGKIGLTFARIMMGLGCRVVGHDPFRSPVFEAVGGVYVGIDELLAHSDFVSLHCRLTEATEHILNRQTLAIIKRGAILINTSRGGQIDTQAAIAALKTGRLSGLGFDVYQHEASLDLQEQPSTVVAADLIQRL